jgi:hypothetical protein
MIGVKFESSVDFLDIKGNNKILVMPAFFFHWLINENQERKNAKKIEIISTIAEFAIALGELKTASNGFKYFLRLYSITSSAKNMIFISEGVKSKIVNSSKFAKKFIQTWDLLDEVLNTYDLSNCLLKGGIVSYNKLVFYWNKIKNDDVIRTELGDNYYKFNDLINDIENEVNRYKNIQ